MPHTLVVGVHLVLIEDGRVLLGRRAGTSFAEGHWHVPAGHLEEGESVLRGTAREAEEELGLRIREDDLALVHTVHQLDADGGAGRMQMFFAPRAYAGDITNREPDKCSALAWFPVRELPEPMVAYTALALGRITAGEPLSVTGRPA